MALYNEILAGRYNRWLQKLLSMKGPASVRQLAAEIQPTMECENMLALENRFIAGWRSYAYQHNLGAPGAGNRAAFRLRNPAGSNAICVIEKLLLGTGLADQPFLNRGPAPATGDLPNTDQANVSIRDFRMGPIGSASIPSFTTNTNAAIVGTTMGVWTLLGNVMFDAIISPSQEIVLAPSDLITLYCNVLNQVLSVTIFYRERALEDSEVAG